ncbi:MAG: NAD-dependent epimerase/dehydratase family protein [bacterium]|nr:NAD-dependent epimerase/dehydratase family protein [bacterium]
MILVTGANGYIGTHLVERLCGGGEAVRALVRTGCADGERRLLAALGAEVIEADLDDPAALMRALEGARSVAHLVGSIERPPRGGYRGMHTLATRRLVAAFRAALPASRKTRPGSRPPTPGRLVYLSALGASPSAGNLYSRTKGEAEEEIRRAGLPHVIIRSSLVFGRRVGRRDSKIIRKLAALAAERRAVPIIGSGGNRIQPIFIGDLVTCMTAALTGGGGEGGTWEAGGPEAMTLREMVERLLRVMGLRRRIVGIPYPAAYALGLAARALRREGRINLEQVRMSRYDSICIDNRAPLLCGGRLVGFEEGMRDAAWGAGG